MQIVQERSDYFEGLYTGLDEEKKQRRSSSTIDDQYNIYIIDTSVLIEDPDVIFKLGRNRIIVPQTVVRELFGLSKNSNPRRSNAAKKAIGTLDMLGCRRKNVMGAITYTGAIISIFSRFVLFDKREITADKRIIGTALRYKLEAGVDNITILSNDKQMRRISQAQGIKAEHYPFRPNTTGKESAEKKKLSLGTIAA